MIARAGALLAVVALGGTSGCAPAKSSAPRPPPAWSAAPAWSMGQGAGSPHASPAPQPPNPYLPLGETKDPWWSPSGGPGAAPPRSGGPALEGPFLILLGWGGARAEERAPEVHATLARLGGVRRAETLWEVAPQPGGGLAPIASALERELCAEDVVVVWRARGAGLERSEFAGHRACPGPVTAPPPSPPARGAGSPARPTPRTTPPAPTPKPADPFDARF